MARVTVEDCVEKVPNRFSSGAAVRPPGARHLGRLARCSSTATTTRTRSSPCARSPTTSVDPEGLREQLITTLQRVDERTEAEEEAETLALLADPHPHADERTGTGPRPAERPRRRSGGAVLSPDGRRPSDPPRRRRDRRSCPNARPMLDPSASSSSGPANDPAPAAPAAKPRPKFLRQYELIERVKRLRSDGRRGPAEPRLCLRHAHARRADRAPRGDPISPTRSRWPAS